jgi:SUMO ligase MMS21 Smc5/6 complex component
VYKITNARTNGGTVVMKRLRYGPCSNIVSVDEMNKEEKKEHLMEMRHAIEIMRRSQNVIVSFDSNVSRFMKVTFDCNVYSVQHTNTVSFDTPTINPAFGF